MAALIPEARAVRSESVRLRGEVHARKLVVRRNTAHVREQLQTAERAMTRMQALHAETLPSQWSTLRWSHNHRALRDVLVSVP